ncbi:DUF2846 domain-containing protein [Myxococcota bacterium]|nr:DUF2846 domain-containing protein [Myxococcota bacterium]
MQRIARFALVFWVVLVLAACLHGPALGPLFRPAGPPDPGRARVYLYRVDAHHSFSTVEIRFDRRKPLHIHDEEYATLELDEGVHELEFRIRRRFSPSSWTWRRQQVRADAGETIYFEIEVGIVEERTPAGRDLKIAGREGGMSGEVVSMRIKSEQEARDAIGRTHLQTR